MANGESYDEFLKGLARQSGIATPTREDLARVDRKRNKKGSNKEWVSRTDVDAEHSVQDRDQASFPFSIV